MMRIFERFLFVVSICLRGFRKKKNTQHMTVSMETVRMAKSRPRKNQSERSDLPQDSWPFLTLTCLLKYIMNYTYITFKVFLGLSLCPRVNSINKCGSLDGHYCLNSFLTKDYTENI